MFNHFEIRPVVADPYGSCQAFDTSKEARRHLTQSATRPAVQGDEDVKGAYSFFFGLYGLESDGTWQHVADRITKTEMLALVKNLLGATLQWHDDNKCAFYRGSTGSPVPLQIWCGAARLPM